MTHRIDTGILVDGVRMPGTDFVLRDSRAWWTPGTPGCHLRSSLDVYRLVGHWTAGRAHVGPDAAMRVYNGMRGRLKPDGVTPLDVGIHFVISWDGMVFQTMDLALKAIHVGSREINETSVGVECCWPGTVANMQRFGLSGQEVTGIADQKPVHCMRPPDALLESWVRLAWTLNGHMPDGFGVPPHVPATLSRFTTKQMRTYRGAMEHWHVRGTTKVDAAGILCAQLKKNGWTPA